MTFNTNKPTYIHHYTNIDTLALILKSKSIRFNRLDHVDDLTESRSISGINFGKYFFVSCWTYSDEESIPRWHMYTNEMTGVRISIIKDLFKREPLIPYPKWRLMQNGEILSPIPFERIFTNDYLILPAFLQESNFCRYVTYKNDLEKIFENAVNFHISQNGEAKLKINNLFDLASYKKTEWSFQKEIRFILFILPSLPIPNRGISDENYLKDLPNHIINCFKRNIGPDIHYFDVEIAKDTFDNIGVTLGPLASDGERLLVEALLEKYTKNGKLIPSKLAGTIRKPMK